jgi:hypothetical protein
MSRDPAIPDGHEIPDQQCRRVMVTVSVSLAALHPTVCPATSNLSSKWNEIIWLFDVTDMFETSIDPSTFITFN